MPEQEGHVEIVLKFLQKASNYLRTPFPVKVSFLREKKGFITLVVFLFENFISQKLGLLG